MTILSSSFHRNAISTLPDPPSPTSPRPCTQRPTKEEKPHKGGCVKDSRFCRTKGGGARWWDGVNWGVAAPSSTRCLAACRAANV